MKKILTALIAQQSLAQRAGNVRTATRVGVTAVIAVWATVVSHTVVMASED